MRLRHVALAAILATGPAVSAGHAEDVLLEHDGGGQQSFYGHHGGADADGDEVSDFLATGSDDASLVIVSGADGGTVRTLPVPQAGSILASRFFDDVTDDGVPDVLVGVSRGARTTAPPPQVRLLNGVTGEELWSAPGDRPSEFFGSEIVVLDDVNGDGVRDVLAAGYLTTRVLSGADGGRLHSLSSNGACCPSEHVAPLGDVNDDGVPDFLVGSPRYSGEFGGARYPDAGGLVRVVSGKDGSILRMHEAKRELESLGNSISALPDIDGDGVTDYVVGTLVAKGRSLSPGLLVYSGASGKKRGRLLVSQVPNTKFMQLIGIAPQDADRDGLPDLWVLATDDDNNAVLLLVSFSKAAQDDPVLFRLQAPEGDFFASFGSAGDLDDDGIADVIVSYSQADVVRVLRVTVLPRIPGKVKGIRAFARADGFDEKVSARLALLVKRGVQTFSIETHGIIPGTRVKAATGPFGVFLEDGVGAGTFTSIGALDAAGAYLVSASGAVPPELGVASLADVVGRGVQIRDSAGAALLESVVPPLAKEKKGKAKGLLSPVSAQFPNAKLKLKATFNPKTGALDIKARIKNAGTGPFRVELETGAGTGAFSEIARVESGKLKLSTGSGSPLAGAFTVADLIGRRVRVYSSDVLVLEGTL